MSLSSIVEFKGTKEGLVLHFLDRRTVEAVLDDIRGKVKGKENFFKGGQIVGVEGLVLEESEKDAIRRLFETELGIPVVSLNQYVKRTFVKVENSDVYETGMEPSAATSIFEGLDEGATKFVRGTLRSGKSIEFGGNVVILGDVNPGAEVIAYGNIIVMGSLRGVAHAGANGNRRAYVVANKLFPTQLRIASMITRASDNPEKGVTVPEIAYIKDEGIVIEAYL